MKKIFSPFKALVCLTFIFFVLGQAFALEIDEKLTFRILSTSSSKKTVLMNRGLEDGLAVGDHAKFFLTTGVIARAVIVKASPSRSIWAIYRLVDDTQIVPDRVLNLKIASPVKVTEDSTKSLQEEKTGEGTDQLAVPAEGDEIGVEKKNSNLNQKEKEDLESMEDEMSSEEPKKEKKVEKPATTSSSRIRQSMDHDTDLVHTFDKSLEFWGTLGATNFMSTTIEVDGASESYGGGTNSIDVSLGGEKYFADKTRWYHRFSLVGMGHYFNQTVQVSESVRSTAKVFEYGFGINTHFGSDSFAYNKPIGFFSLLFGVGSASSSTETDTASTSREGTAQFISIGPGIKYYLSNGFGARLLMDYYKRSEAYEADEVASTGAMNKSVGGLRFQFGLSWRF